MLGAPTTLLVMLAQGILYRGAGLRVVWPQFLALALIGAAFFGIALARFRKTRRTPQGEQKKQAAPAGGAAREPRRGR
jgi:ABC-2 type transport system permease protein